MRATWHCASKGHNALRLSPNLANTRDDLDRFFTALGAHATAR